MKTLKLGTTFHVPDTYKGPIPTMSKRDSNLDERLCDNCHAPYQESAAYHPCLCDDCAYYLAEQIRSR
jgi:hypothetical protein